MNNLKDLFEYAKAFKKNDWRQVALQFNSVTPNTMYAPVIEGIRKFYPELDRTEACYLIRNELQETPSCSCGKKLTFRTDPTHGYAKFCSMSCRSTTSNTQAESIIVDGIVYNKFPDAMAALNLSREVIRYRLYDPEFETYKWNVKDHDEKCLQKLKEHNELLTNKDVLLQWKESGEAQTSFCERMKIEKYQFRCALLFFGIETAFEQVNPLAREFLNDKERFVKEFDECSIERLALIYNVTPRTIKLYAIQYGQDTSKWANGVSKGEHELYLFIKTMYDDAIQSYRGAFGKNGSELDIYIPTLNIGIEFNGVYMHSDKVRDKEYHRKKHLAFREKGIRYIQVWEDDWLYRHEKVKRFLRNALGYNQERIGARKTGVRDITQEEFDAFMTDNHMQGKTKAKYRIGLFKDGVLLSAMGFRELASNVDVRYANGKGIDLIRFANTNVTGAFTKLLNYFQKKHCYDYVLSYADLEIVSPFKNVYTSNGFEFVKEIQEDYRYFNSKTKVREHKFNWRKKAFENMGIDITDKTEFQLANELGLMRCFDSGKILYIRKYSDRNIISDDVTLDC
jgi:hypothetical protein